MNKTLIGLTTYGPIPRAEILVETIFKTVDSHVPHEIAIADDSRGGGFNITNRRQFCKKNKIALLEGETITGIPASWNRLVNHAQERGCDKVVILSDGVRFLVPGWLSRLTYFLDNNEKIGTVGTPTVGTPYFDGAEKRWEGKPGVVGCAVGCSFAFRTETHGKILNPDNSIGFWEDLVSFHEELQFGFKLAESGYLSYMLPWPPSYYRGGMAFASHNELIWRTASPYLPLEEFLYWVRKSPWYVSQYEEKYGKGEVDKMSYSRVMFAKYWGLIDEVKEGKSIQEIKGEQVSIMDEPQKPVHIRTVDIWPTRTMKWLDKAGKEQQGEI